MFSCEFCEISKKTFFIEQLQTTASLTTLLAVFRSFVARRCEKAPWFTKFYDLLQYNFFMCQQRPINGLGYWWKWKYHETTLSAVKTINISLKRGPHSPNFNERRKNIFRRAAVSILTPDHLTHLARVSYRSLEFSTMTSLCSR